MAAAVAARIARIPAVRCVARFNMTFPPFPSRPAFRARFKAEVAATREDALIANDRKEEASTAPALISPMAFINSSDGELTRFPPPVSRT